MKLTKKAIINYFGTYRNIMDATLWHKVSFWIGITLTMAAASRTQCPLSCHCLTDDIVTCHLQTRMDYLALTQLSDKTKTLSLVITGSFREDLADFSNMGVLENLKLMADRKYSSYDEAVLDDAVSSFEHRHLFHLFIVCLLSVSSVYCRCPSTWYLQHSIQVFSNHFDN